MSYLLAFLGFAALILLHEGGHFAAAKAVGMRVERFSLFFGPMLWSRRIGETEYGIAAIPLGGYVKITGMNPDETFETPEIAARAYTNQPVWKRIVVIAAGPGVNVVLALLLATVAFMGLGWHYATNQRGQAIITNRVQSVVGGSAAAGVLRPGDVIVSIDGVRGDFAQLHHQIQTHPCAGGERINGCRAVTPLRIVVRRHGAVKTLSLRPRWSSAQKEMLVGFRPSGKHVPNTVAYSAGQSVSALWLVTERTATAIGQIFKPKERRQLHSVVGVYTITAHQIASGWTNGVWILAEISLSLGLINLLPFLPLDGGHILWAVMEKVRGRRISVTTIQRASFVGIALIALLFAIGLSNDVSSLAGGGFKQ